MWLFFHSIWQLDNRCWYQQCIYHNLLGMKRHRGRYTLICCRHMSMCSSILRFVWQHNLHSSYMLVECSRTFQWRIPMVCRKRLDNNRLRWFRHRYLHPWRTWSLERIRSSCIEHYRQRSIDSMCMELVTSRHHSRLVHPCG